MEKIIDSNVVFKQQVPVVIQIEIPRQGYELVQRYIYYNNLTGITAYTESECCKEAHHLISTKTQLDDHHKVYHKNAYSEKGVAYFYDPDNDCFVIIFVELKFIIYDVNHIDKIEFNEIERIYITRNKEIVKQNKIITLNDFAGVLDVYTKSKIRYINSTLFQSTKYNTLSLSTTYFGINYDEYELQKMGWNIVFLSCNFYTKVYHISDAYDFLRYKEPLKTSGTMQNKIDYYCEKTNNQIDCTELLNLEKSGTTKMGFIDWIEDNVCCLRVFIFDYLNKIAVESTRIYITKNSFYFCKKNNYGDFVYVKQNLGLEHWDFKISTFEPFVTKGTLLEYFGSIIDNVLDENRGYALIALLKHPFLEKLCKNNMSYIIFGLFEIKPGDIYLYLKANFLNFKEGDFSWLNSYQINRIINKVKNCTNRTLAFNKLYESNILKETAVLKSTLFRIYSNIFKDANSIDNNTFDIMLDAFDNWIFSYVQQRNHINDSYYGINKINDELYLLYDTFELLIKNHGYTNLSNNVNILNSINDIFLTYVSPGHKNSKVYFDYITTIDKIKDVTPEFNRFTYKIKTMQELFDNHEAVINIYNNFSLMKKNEKFKKQFDERAKSWKKFEYTDDNFPYLITVPVGPMDIATEGIKLKHCVATYIERIAAGGTTILFLRKIEDPSEPFFTIEVTNEDTVVQIHGFNNNNLVQDSKEMDFIKKWIQIKKLKCILF